jgi:hypothetical protein
MAAVAVMAPIAVQALFVEGSVATFSLTNASIDVANQLLVRSLMGNLDEFDFADVVIAGSGANLVGGALLGSSIDIAPFAKDQSKRYVINANPGSFAANLLGGLVNKGLVGSGGRLYTGAYASGYSRAAGVGFRYKGLSPSYDAT